jgi:hypothetical protein
MRGVKVCVEFLEGVFEYLSPYSPMYKQKLSVFKKHVEIDIFTCVGIFNYITSKYYRFFNGDKFSGLWSSDQSSWLQIQRS